ncbi:MAG: zf-HC2 domain-containing protein [Gemmatimonadota bacterium]
MESVQCGEFHARHAEYVDGMLTASAAARLASHADACAACARYDRIIRKGAELVRDMPAVVPSEDFEHRLQHRIFHMQDARMLSPRPTAGAAAALGVAAFIALLAWSPVLFSGEIRPRTAVTDTPPGSDLARAPSAGLPYAARTQAAALTASDRDASNLPSYIGSEAAAWYPVSAAPQRATLAAFPGPHSPLIVTPPAHRSVRTVSSQYAPVE